MDYVEESFKKFLRKTLSSLKLSELTPMAKTFMRSKKPIKENQSQKVYVYDFDVRMKNVNVSFKIF